MKVIALTGSVSGRKTPIALKHVMDHMTSTYPNIVCEFINIGDYNLEFSDGRPINAYNPDTQIVLNKILEADALIVGTPTYQTSIPGALKNIFDLLPMHSLSDKIAGIVVTAASPKYFLMAEQQLKPILSYMGAHIVQKYVFIEDCCYEDLKIVETSIVQRLQNLGDDIYWAVCHLEWQNSSRHLK